MDPIVELAPNARAFGKSVPPASGGSHPVYAFLGLPYAEPPVGSLRFQPPKPISLWSGDRHATTFGSICPQKPGVMDALDFVKFTKSCNMSEDCLFLNVWTPTLQIHDNKPVMVFIHGGGFIAGDSNHYHGTAPVSLEDVIVVTINYRLGIFGFMTTGDGVAPGNYGLMDQIEALRWVQKNIKAFGGNPGNVTIYGESAGGMSVSGLLLSPLARGLFHRAIIESGTLKSHFYIRTHAVAINSFLPVLERMGCKSEKSEDIVRFLRDMPALEMQSHLLELDQFTPVIDGYVLHADDVSRGRSGIDSGVDTLIGCNSHEGYFPASFFMKKDHNDRSAAIMGLNFLVGGSFDPGNADVDAIRAAVREEYLVEDKSEDALFKQVVDCFGDIIFVIPTFLTALAQSHSKANTFVYRLTYRMSSSEKPRWIRAEHAADLVYVFGWPLFDTTDQLQIKTNEQDDKMSRRLIKYWANFARTGNPNGNGLPEWPKYTPNEQKYLLIDSECSVDHHMKSRKMDFWSKVLARYTNQYQNDDNDVFS